jgi:teichuronic acid biosynthesis glycosyltransferase TuaH
VASLDDSFVACGERHRVLYATDDFVAGAEQMGLAAADLERDQRHRLAEADIVITASAVLADKWAALGKQTTVVRNGVDNQLFAATDEARYPDDVRLASPIAGFIGRISERIDFGLLEAIASRGRSLLLVGPRAMRTEGARLDRLLRHPTVQWVGARPLASLPGYLRRMDVGLVPYRDSAFNRASFPIKTLEYLAAGRAVVATDLPAIRSLGTDLVDVASTPSAFADAVERALSMPRSDSVKRERQAFAQQHGWDGRAEAFARAIGL